MRRLRFVGCKAGWLALIVLAGLGLWQGAGGAALAPGGWFWSLAAALGLAAVLCPAWMLRALPAASLATLLGGLVFSLLPDLQGQGAAMALMLGAGGAAGLSALLCFGGRAAVGMALLAGGVHIGLMQVLTVAPMASPFVVWPWSAPGLLSVWMAVGTAISLTAPRSGATPRRAAKDNPESTGSK
ncbi:hypothetical protein [Antarctobacter sp.]|uniref:hypothetical protein n=1 Tax=Antarctobacter sp. TaxID=1872577 RepID=UPI002B279B64|nr:hypothetical protein [Antarctobacter sp.]